MKLLLPILMAVALGGVLTTNTLRAQEMSEKRKITISGTGDVSVEPDQAMLRFDVVTRDADPEVARASNAQASRDALNALRDLGIDEAKIKMEQLSLNPVREWDPDQRKQIEMGFEVRRGVSVEIVELDKVPNAVAYVVQSGANRIGGVSYGLSDEDPTRQQALRLAIANARSKASAMLSELGETLGAVQEIREESVHMPMPVVRASAAMMEKSADAPEPEAYAPGQVKITASVVATFAIE